MVPRKHSERFSSNLPRETNAKDDWTHLQIRRSEATDAIGIAYPEIIDRGMKFRRVAMLHNMLTRMMISTVLLFWI
jgi:hypothetical protein